MLLKIILEINEILKSDKVNNNNNNNNNNDLIKVHRIFKKNFNTLEGIFTAKIAV